MLRLFVGAANKYVLLRCRSLSDRKLSMGIAVETFECTLQRNPFVEKTSLARNVP